MSIAVSSGNRGISATLVLLALLTIAVYGNSLANGFVWDDEFIIVSDPVMRDLSGAAALLVSPDVVKPCCRPPDWKSDIALFGSVVRTDPGSSFGHFNLGNSLRDAGDLEGAQQEWLETLRLDPANSGAMTQLGSLAAVKGDFGKAERWFRAALDADPANAMARFNPALVFEKTGRPEEALAQYDLFLRNVPLEYREYIPRAEENKARLRKGAK